MLKRTITSFIVALVAITLAYSATSTAQEYYVDKAIVLTAPIGGVTAGSPYVIRNQFVVAAESKAAGQPFAALFKNVVVTLAS